MTILLTGGAGYIGSHMALALKEFGEDFVVVDDLSTGHVEFLSTDTRFINADFADKKVISDLISEHQIEAIFHFAASTPNPDSVMNPLTCYDNNTIKIGILVELAVAGGVKHFLFSSSAAVYGNPKAKPFNEKSATVPITAYGRSKLFAEQILRDVSQAHEMSFVALRCVNVAGADPLSRCGPINLKATHLLDRTIKTATGQLPIKSISSDGSGVSDYIHVSDLVSAHLLALDYLRKGNNSRVLNCGYDRGYSRQQVIDAVRNISGVDFAVEGERSRCGDRVGLVVDSSKIMQLLDWQPEYDDIETIVCHALAWENKLLKSKAVK